MSRTVYGRWQRPVKTILSEDGRTYTTHTEYLNMDKAVARLHEAMAERGDGGLRGWLDVALNGWPSDGS